MAHNPLELIIGNSRLQIESHNIETHNSFRQLNRVLDAHGVSYMKSGRSVLRIGDKEYHANAGDILIIPPGVLHDHSMEGTEPACFMWWNFTYKLYDVIDIMRMLQLPTLYTPDDSMAFERAFSSYMRQAQSLRSLSDYFYREAHAYEMTAILLDLIIGKNAEDVFPGYSYAFIEILAEIVNHPQCCNLLTMLSDRFHMHPTYISNQFKRLYGVTPSQFHRRVRLKKAADMLVTDLSKPVGEIAYELGYEQLPDFTRFFKKHYGHSPIQHRKLHLEGKSVHM